MPRLVTASAEGPPRLFSKTLAHGHEGVVVKSSPPRTRRAARHRMDQVKPRHPRPGGAGRRVGPGGAAAAVQLPGRPRPATGGLPARQDVQGADRRAADLADRTAAGWAPGLEHVYVRPELVAESLSTACSAAPATRAASRAVRRVLRYRDKTAAEADTIDTGALGAGYLGTG
jgi:DNA ligase-1